MQTVDLNLIAELLPEAKKRTPLERLAFFDELSLAPIVRTEIESLLDVAAEAADFLSITASGLSHDFWEADAAEALIGQHIGSHKILSEIGTGGMGAVYLAERADNKFDQRVAVKMLRRELNTVKIRKNFDREKSILASLSHTNIARLLDAGTTDDGIPFLVMEYVDGIPIDKFCLSNDLTLNERLKLFNKACETVSFAHRNLIVHRDLKPSNILVTEDGEPKLLDFGISTILAANGAQNRAATLMRAHTPAYAAPEQIKGERATTAADVYSLGLVLYKMLTGSHPLDSSANDNAAAASTVLNESERTNGARSAVRPEQLKGDLDNILRKALAPEPENRYSSVEQFAADVWRHIDGQPVSARRATLGYRISRFYRRNKIATVAAALIFISILAGGAVSLRQTRVARAQAALASEARNAALIESENAKSEQAKSEKVSKFIATIISYANPAWYAEGARYGGDARVIDAMNDLSAKIDTEFAGEADVQSELHHKFSEVYLFAGPEYLEKQKYHALRALELRRQFYGERHELVAKDLFYASTFIGKDAREQAVILDNAIAMMRETNPRNLNLPYMLEAYVAGLALPGYDSAREIYRESVTPRTNERAYEIAERYLHEALSLFRLHYKEGHSIINYKECELSYVLLMQEKWQAFDEHYPLCNEGVAAMTQANDANRITKQQTDIRQLIENRLAEKRPSN